MKVVLLERIEKLGRMGDVVDVKTGYACNFLLPKGKALRATNENLAQFEAQRARLEEESLRHKATAEERAKALDGIEMILIRQSSEAGHLYGSVAARDIAQLVTEGFFGIDRSQVRIDRPIKEIGVHEIVIALHPEVKTTVKVSIAPTAEEAQSLLSSKGKKENKKEEQKEAAADNA